MQRASCEARVTRDYATRQLRGTRAAPARCPRDARLATRASRRARGMRANKLLLWWLATPELTSRVRKL
jgi:hypothetical protein